MLLIFTHKITPRFSYIMKHVCANILGLEVTFTTKIEDFIKHSGPKITYTKQPLQNEFFIKSHSLLFEQGINAIDIKVQDWNGIPCFFGSGEKSALPFDVFAASFYLISRYEEYLPHVKDPLGRFPPEESLAYIHGFLKLPVVDIWAYRFLSVLKEKFPDIVTKPKEFKYTSLIDVSSSHCFLYKGIIRTILGAFLDLYKLKFMRFFSRWLVLLGLRKDPYDNFEYLIEAHRKHKVDSMFFFQVANYSNYDKNVSIHKNKFRFLLKTVADYSVVSLKASFKSFSNPKLLKIEKKRLSDTIHRPIKAVRLRFNRINVPYSYMELLDTEFTKDFSMGYTDKIGFRAGTCTPFYFYNLNNESRISLKIFPFAIHDYALLNYNRSSRILQTIKSIKHVVKSVNGHFITVFSNELLGDGSTIRIRKSYLELISKIHE